MRWTFTALRFGLLVGIGGGVPSAEHDVRLGDVVVSKPTDTSGGVIQYDFGKTVQAGRFQRTGSLNKPPIVLLGAVASLNAKHMMEEPALSKHITDMAVKYTRLQPTTVSPGAQNDRLFEAEYGPPREDGSPAIHYGLIASGNQVMRDGRTRERLRQELNVLCFEMEAAGLMDDFPCLVIRGICDYADSHKNKQWQPYAATTAAAYAKELLQTISGSQVVRTQSVIKSTAAAGE
jgi:nucleoside phosphorylase